MTVESDADVASFLDPREFGTTLTHRLPGGGTVTVPALRTDPSPQAGFGGDVHIPVTEFAVLAESLPDVGQDSVLVTDDGAEFVAMAPPSAARGGRLDIVLAVPA